MNLLERQKLRLEDEILTARDRLAQLAEQTAGAHLQDLQALHELIERNGQLIEMIDQHLEHKHPLKALRR